MNVTRLLTVFVVLFFAKAGYVYAQFEIPPKPTGTAATAIHDYVNLLNNYERNALETKLRNYADSTSTQIVIAAISSTNGDNISMLGAEWGQEWGIGQEGKDNGILILIAKEDRTVDINTGYGIEYIISDFDAERMINRIIVPNFKQGRFYQGLDETTNEMIARLSGHYVEDRTFDRNGDRGGFPKEIIIMIVMFIIIIALSGNRRGGGGKGGGRRRGMSVADIIILSNMGRGSFGGSSGGGFSGGFGGGFGGGGFGGGGASGGW